MKVDNTNILIDYKIKIVSSNKYVRIQEYLIAVCFFLTVFFFQPPSSNNSQLHFFLLEHVIQHFLITCSQIIAGTD